MIQVFAAEKTKTLLNVYEIFKMRIATFKQRE